MIFDPCRERSSLRWSSSDQDVYPPWPHWGWLAFVTLGSLAAVALL